LFTWSCAKPVTVNWRTLFHKDRTIRECERFGCEFARICQNARPTCTPLWYKGRSFVDVFVRGRFEQSRWEMSLRISCKSVCAIQHGVCTCSSQRRDIYKIRIARRSVHRRKPMKGENVINDVKTGWGKE
jgi:hypothetical protein